MYIVLSSVLNVGQQLAGVCKHDPVSWYPEVKNGLDLLLKYGVQKNTQQSQVHLYTVKSYTRQILHSVLAIKMGQAPTESYIEHTKNNYATEA